MLLLGLAGLWLWLSLLSGPYDLASGLLRAEGDVHHARHLISAGALKQARFRTLDAVAAVRTARHGYRGGGPLLDLAAGVPRLGDALHQVPHILDAASYSADAARGTLAIAQGALRGPGRIIAHGSNGSRIRLDRVAVVGREMGGVETDLRRARSALAAIDLAALPHALRLKVQSGIAQADQAVKLLSTARAGFRLLPAILGAHGKRTYVLAFQNPAEERGAGGAMLQYAVIDFVHGAPHLERKTKTVYTIDRNRQPLPIPLPRDAWYVRAIPDAQRFGNSNWSPDWPLSAKLMLAYGRASTAAFPRKVDGMIGIDPIAADEMMPGIGAFRSPHSHVRVSAANLVNLVLFKAYASYPIPAVRRIVLHDIVKGFYRGMFDPARPADLVKGMGDALATKHIQIWMARPSEEAFVRRMGWDGALARARHADYLDVVEQNVGGNKLDYFETRALSLDVRLHGRDAVDHAAATIGNPVVMPQPRWSMGDSGPFHHPMLNFYTPGNAELVAAHGPPVATGRDPVPRPVRLPDSPAGLGWGPGLPPTHTEKGKRVWSGTLDIPPQQKASMSLTYRVPGVVQTRHGRSTYRLVLQQQPGVHPATMSVTLHLPPGASHVSAPGFRRRGDVLTWSRLLDRDTTLTVSWR